MVDKRNEQIITSIKIFLGIEEGSKVDEITGKAVDAIDSLTPFIDPITPLIGPLFNYFKFRKSK